MEVSFAELMTSGTLLVGLANSWWAFRLKTQALRNERLALTNQLSIEQLHACLDGARQDQAEMHAENQPVIKATLETVKEIRDTVKEGGGTPGGSDGRS